MSLRSKKVIYNKVIGSVLNHISTKYEKKEMKISEDERGYNLKADYMMGIKRYILKIGQACPDWLDNFKTYFMKDYEIEEDNDEAKDPSLFLLSGTIESILDICDAKFLAELLSKLDLILHIGNKG